MWLMRTAFKICFPPSGVKAVAQDIVRTLDDAAASGLASRHTSGTDASLMDVVPEPTPKPVTHDWFLLAFWVLIALFSFSFAYGIPLGVLIVIGLAIYFKITSKRQAKAPSAPVRRTLNPASRPGPAIPSGSIGELKLPAMETARADSAIPITISQPPHPGVPAG